ncbi:hypothetical protein [Pajaroellobacter abortibovis]|uniref:Uncharacterized protein n=1 Tax=Pajaroellobacter abortibovis TaxID=1882918 RepID=A0A1L6MZ71_9BACT|nr:hypothetical protein [Pajaroellobacter abortibovis]APS00806.1 hypothetical protein BCY86_09040 [Pajaroellobacter abortibovis]
MTFLRPILLLIPLISMISIGLMLGLHLLLLTAAGLILFLSLFLMWTSLSLLFLRKKEDFILLDSKSDLAIDHLKEQVFLSIAQIEEGHQTGKIDDLDYKYLTSQYRQEAKKLLCTDQQIRGPLRDQARAEAKIYLAKQGISESWLDDESKS